MSLNTNTCIIIFCLKNHIWLYSVGSVCWSAMPITWVRSLSQAVDDSLSEDSGNTADSIITSKLSTYVFRPNIKL